MLGRDEGSKFLHRLCWHRFFCEVVPVRNSSAEEAVSVGVCFCTAQREAAAVVSGEPPDDVAGGEVRSTGGLDLPLAPHRSGVTVRKDSAGMAGTRPSAIL